MNKKTVILIGLTLLLAGCANAVPTPAPGADVAGFWTGLWHGLILPFAFIGSLFNSDIGIYEIVNNGGWYNFGYVLGLGAMMGGVTR